MLARRPARNRPMGTPVRSHGPSDDPYWPSRRIASRRGRESKRPAGVRRVVGRRRRSAPGSRQVVSAALGLGSAAAASSASRRRRPRLASASARPRPRSASSAAASTASARPRLGDGLGSARLGLGDGLGARLGSALGGRLGLGGVAASASASAGSAALLGGSASAAARASLCGRPRRRPRLLGLGCVGRRPPSRRPRRRRLGSSLRAASLGGRVVGLGVGGLVGRRRPRAASSDAASCWRTWANAAASVLSIPPSGSWTASDSE